MSALAQACQTGGPTPTSAQRPRSAPHWRSEPSPSPQVSARCGMLPAPELTGWETPPAVLMVPSQLIITHMPDWPTDDAAPPAAASHGMAGRSRQAVAGTADQSVPRRAGQVPGQRRKHESDSAEHRGGHGAVFGDGFPVADNSRDGTSPAQQMRAKQQVLASQQHQQPLQWRQPQRQQHFCDRESQQLQREPSPGLWPMSAECGGGDGSPVLYQPTHTPTPPFQLHATLPDAPSTGA